MTNPDSIRCAPAHGGELNGEAGGIRDSDRLWDAVVRATAELGPDATALRIPLLISFQSPDSSLRRDLRNLLEGAKQFLTLAQAKRSNEPNGGMLFCFAHTTPANVGNLLPVAREALRRGLLGGIVTGADSLAQLSEFEGAVPIVSARQLLGQLGLRDRAKNALRVADVFRKVSESVDRHAPTLSSRLAANRGMLIREIVRSVQFGLVFAHLLDRWSPSSVVSTADFWPFEHQLFCQAARRKIPSIVIQHGTMGCFWWPFVADLYCVWGSNDVKQMQRFGAPAERITMAGMPASDELFRRMPKTQNNRLGTQSRPVCLILSHTHGKFEVPEAYQQFKQILPQVIRSTPSFDWRVKLHPVEDDSFYRGLDKLIFERLKFYPKETSLEEAVNDADVVTTIYSTAGLQAMIMDRPLIVAPATPQVQEVAWWPTMGGGTYASSTGEFLEQLTQLVSSQDYRLQRLDQQRRFLTNSFANPGHAAERIVDLLEALSGHSAASQAQSQPSSPIEAEISPVMVMSRELDENHTA